MTDLQIVIVLAGLAAAALYGIWRLWPRPTPDCTCARDRHGIRMWPDPDCPLHTEKP